MKNLNPALGMALSAFIVSSASASDLTGRPNSIFDWTGFYAGAHAGIARPAADYTVLGFRTNITEAGLAGGGFVGFNYQVDRIVLGLEADFSFNTAQKNFPNFIFAGDNIRVTGHTNISGRVRAGYAFDNILPYVTAGIASGTFALNYTLGALNATFSTTRTGWAIGAGVEYGLSANWIARAEYSYQNFGQINNVLIAGDFGILDIHTARIGLSYKF